MKKTLAAGLVGLTLSFGALAAAPAFAQGGPSVDSTPIADLAAKPETKAILDKDVPGLTAHPAFDQFKGMTLKALQPMSGGQLTDDQIAAVQADLDKLPK
ncbi:hypothetical protein [Phenylobacterium aquaticum]|uniref:hypothetical protein n=1 Tax=Phenylobacterium aquaticum TaxID=1763816 RepID=UPI0026EC195A|nr:hypothetical protein [Phenylobacterium aquaticum]